MQIASPHSIRMATEVVPTVLPSGTVWDFVHSRLLIGVEQLALQGIQFEEPTAVTNNQAQDLAGNALLDIKRSCCGSIKSDTPKLKS